MGSRRASSFQLLGWVAGPEAQPMNSSRIVTHGEKPPATHAAAA